MPDGAAVAVDVPTVPGVDAAVFPVSTDAPEADGWPRPGPGAAVGR